MIKKAKAAYIECFRARAKIWAGSYLTFEAAKKRLRQVEFFRHSN